MNREATGEAFTSREDFRAQGSHGEVRQTNMFNALQGTAYLVGRTPRKARRHHLQSCSKNPLW